ncbi:MULTISPECIES: cell wall metabolism sensor histidine kinase WalK [unclassified Leptotrichia]|uniref:sensor histidine kinase n=1 Tax=unclassified Leptotrichia TaxID=2633022 RepID=UPI0003ADFF88|nr:MULTISPECIES: HAMP domain-containing sensor histidine kinase [unclassified Leptotrichia]ERL27168.1 ATPase/histidine kinase/DNA gyrase B/HSP90 domain protein [Leptotrichia sp. oral taxon 225 str. F0581]WLD74698.1 HAMP domain-containing sensor histidine kinase [Leptotrichia sp. HMT-225]
MKIKGIKFKNKIFIKLLSYFGLSLLLFSIVIGSIFGYIYIQNTVSLHKKDLVERAYKISTTLSKMWFEDGNENLENKDRKPPSKDTSSEKPVRREKPKIVGNINGKAFENNVIENIRKNETEKRPEEKNSKKLLDERHFHRHRIVDEKDNNVKIFRSMRMIEDIAMGEVWIVDAKTGNIVQGRNEKGQPFSYLKLPPNAEETIKKAISGETTTTENFNDYLNENSITVAVPIKNGETIEGVVLLHSPVKYMSSALKSGIYTLIFSILAALILASISAVWLSISFTKPLNKIRDTTTELAKGNYEVTTQIKQSDEIGELAKSIDKLALQLDKSSKESERFQKMRQNFIANISHELRTPITVIRGSIEAICDGVISNPEQLKDYNEQILSDSIHLQRLVNDLIDLTKLQNTDFSIDKSTINLFEIINDAVRSMKQISTKKGVKINFSAENAIEEDRYLFVGDYQRIRQMIIIVLDNAIKFSNENQKVDILLKKENKKYELKICDSGRGIDPENIGEIFNRYHKSNTEENKNGMGLGLAIAKEIALRHNIEIFVKSVPNIKTVFTFLIPLNDLQ